MPVTGSDADAYYFRIVADYIHLNPARAGLAGGRWGPLTGYPWSSLPSYIKGNGPEWLVMERVLRSFELAQDRRGRRAYVAWLEARANNAGGEIDEEAMQAIRRGWYLGKETFKGRLMKLLEKAGQTSGGMRNRTGEALREHGQADAGRIVRRGVKILGLPATAAAMAKLPKGDGRKVAVAAFLRDRTSVGNSWIASRLAMGHPGSVSRLIGSCRKSGALSCTIKQLAEAIDDV